MTPEEFVEAMLSEKRKLLIERIGVECEEGCCAAFDYTCRIAELGADLAKRAEWCTVANARIAELETELVDAADWRREADENIQALQDGMSDRDARIAELQAGVARWRLTFPEVVWVGTENPSSHA